MPDNRVQQATISHQARATPSSYYNRFPDGSSNHRQEQAAILRATEDSQQVRAARQPQQGQTQAQPQHKQYRSTLKRNPTSTPESQVGPQSLASFFTSNTLDSKRRVRIADQPDELDKDDYSEARVEIYHNSWLDRQLGRASKRRNSNELNERQVKEKAMIEELKQNLRNGAITLRQSLRGKKSNLSGSHTIGSTRHHKEINLLPNSPPPYNPSPMTPTQQLKAASPSLSPSPSPSRSPYLRQDSDFTASQMNGRPQPCQQYSSKTLGPQLDQFKPQKQQQQQQQPQVLRGTRIIPAPVTANQSTHHMQQPQRQHQQSQSQPQQNQSHLQQQIQQQQIHQPVYANPHASLMKHRMEQQTNRPTGTNHASIREFNELDSLLRSLSPSSTHITPGFTSKPVQPSFGYGQTLPNPKTNTTNRNNTANPDVYARIQKPQPLANNLQQPYGTTSLPIGGQSFTVDVTNKKDDENCIRNQNLSDFEPPVEIIPSMEDYQNIAKLSPVKNHYWYKPNMSRERAINLLKDKPQGTFIVRDSTSFKGAYGLAVKVSKLPKNVLNNAHLRNPNADPSSELIRHFLIEPTSEGVRLKGYSNEPVFNNLPSLIYQHSLTELALPCKLIIPRADIEDPAFNQKQRQFFNEFLAEKEIAKHNPYARTSPNGGYRKYPGDVYVHNEHRIIFE